MKKIIAGISLCLLVLSACVVFASDIDSRYLGDWYIHSVRVDDAAFHAGDSGLIVKFTVEGDGTVTRTDPDGSQDTGTWTSDDASMLISWDDSGVLELLYIDGVLVSVSEDGGLSMHLESTKPEPSSGKQPDYRKDAKAADFDGDWMSISVTAHGITIPMSEMNERIDLQIRNGKLVALNDIPVLPSVTSHIFASTLIINNQAEGIVSVMQLLSDGSAILKHLHQPDAYFTLIPVR